MIFTETKLKGAYFVDIERREDERGFFGRIWCKEEVRAAGLNASVAQANVSYNKSKGTLRGMHYQVDPYSECKWVRCTSGSLYDVIVDIRPESPTFKEWIGVELSAQNARTMYVPGGFAHGFVTLEDHTSVHYMVSQYYVPGAERGIPYNDPGLRIEWPLTPLVISDKDKAHAPFSEWTIHERLDVW